MVAVVTNTTLGIVRDNTKRGIERCECGIDVRFEGITLSKLIPKYACPLNPLPCTHLILVLLKKPCPSLSLFANQMIIPEVFCMNHFTTFESGIVIFR